MSDDEAKSGPSRAGVILGALSVLLCAVLVVLPISVWISIVVLLIWLFVVCPMVIETSQLEFWDSGGVDLTTGCVGFLWWVVLTWQLEAAYTAEPWLLGMVLAVFTAIMVGKMARHWMSFVVMLLGFVLGWVGIWLNWLVNLTGGPLATSVITEQTSWGLFTLMVLTALVILSITTVAKCSYYTREVGGLVSKVNDLERALDKKRDGGV